MLTIPPLTPELLGRAIRRWTGRRAPALSALDIAGLDLTEIVAAFRPRTTPAACVARLKRASAARSILRLDDKTPVLADLAGYSTARDWCLDLATDISAVRDGALEARQLESCLFFGPPGTGKSTLALSLAKTTRLPLIATSVGHWFSSKDGHLGEVIRQINEVFDRALAAAPAILFIDEIDALPDRASPGRNSDFSGRRRLRICC